jgi:hypothetical protein
VSVGRGLHRAADRDPDTPARFASTS